MGFPINDFSIYEAIISGRSLALTQDHFEKCKLRRFNAYALILHDPHIHNNFHEFLENQFEMLDQITGEELLFFAMTTPPKKWFEKATSRDYMNLDWSMQHIADKKTEAVLGGVLTSLGLSMQYLPCAIVTTDMRAKNWHVIRLNEKTINPILFELGTWANLNGDTKALPNFINNIPLVSVNSPNRLSELLSPSVSAKYSNVNSVAKKLNNQNLKSIEDTIQKCRNFLCEDDSQNLDHLENLDKVMLGLFYLQACGFDSNIDDNGLPEIQEHLDPDSQLIYKSLRSWINYANQFRSGDFDYSPGIVSAAKIFEIEQSKSIVHWARSVMGVDLPLYYCKYDPKAGPCTVGNDFVIDYNFQKKGIWIPPSLGQGLDGIRNLIKNSNSIPGGYEKNIFRELFECVDSIVPLRNPAAHSRAMTITEWRLALSSLLSFINKGGFEKYHHIKTCYKPELGMNDNEPIQINISQLKIESTKITYSVIVPKPAPRKPQVMEVETMKKKNVDEALQMIFAPETGYRRNDINYYSLMVFRMASYYLDLNTDPNIKSHLNKLWKQLSMFEYQDALKKAIENSRSKNFRLECPDISYRNRENTAPPQEININPAFTISEVSEVDLINEYRRVEGELSLHQVDIAFLLSFIKQSAISSQDWKWE